MSWIVLKLNMVQSNKLFLVPPAPIKLQYDQKFPPTGEH